ncbi:sensor domain-containing phosphodiesterase [Vibrio sp. WXL103]|uniref:sensor domain-containing phosphodiesterase n=1 Tax=unclassified Vibrio TaxID=2614977 RepID=UPI003EC90099
MSKIDTSQVPIPSNTQASWQNIVNLIAEMIDVPSVLIVRFHDQQLEVFSSNDNRDHVYQKGNGEELGQGLYSETVIASQQALLIPDSLNDPRWQNTPEVKMGMIAYLGLPISWPTGECFGTLCVFDTKANPFSDMYRKLLEAFRDCLESQLSMLFLNESLKLSHQSLRHRMSNRAKNIAELNFSLSEEISKRQAAERAVEYQKWHDQGTGLLNRRALEHELNSLGDAVTHHFPGFTAVIHITLSNGRRLQTKYGYIAWDATLMAFAQRIEAVEQGEIIVGRPTSSELVVIFRSVSEPARVHDFCQKVLDISTDEFRLDGQSVHLHCHIGVATSQHETIGTSLLTHAAEAALASRDSGHKFSFYQPTDSNTSHDLNVKESYLLQAVRNDDLLLYFQPKVDPTTHRWIGAEALLRWKHPVLGDISNEGLIRLAEQNGLIFEVGNFVLRSAIEKAASWASQFENFTIAVNVSSVQLKSPLFAQQVEELLGCHDLPARFIELEITEGGLIADETLAKQTLFRLKSTGVGLLLDDFGTGYASFSYLKKFPFDGIKVDKSFLNQVEDSYYDKEIIRSIIHIAKKLDLKVTIEGVETKEHESFIIHHGGDVGQGYYYGKPMPCDEFEYCLLNQSHSGNNSPQIEP